MMYSLDEIGLIPSQTTQIKHRGDINPFVQSPFGGEKLPIFVSPMTCLLNANNICEFARSQVEPILPVMGDLETRVKLPNGSDWRGWTAYTLDEFKSLFNFCKAEEDRKYYALIDVANGHMEEIFTLVKDAKQEYGDNLIVMIGNIANPGTYIECCKARVDYVRVGIGGGTGCTTSVQTGIHTSMPWILEGIKKFKDEGVPFIDMLSHNRVKMTFKNFLNATKGIETKIIADGGITTTSRAIKCLALGADYVMMGKAFAQCMEVPGERTLTTSRNHYYGQSSEQGQKDRFGYVKSNPEGSDCWIDVTTNLVEFTTKFAAALRSSMSYCNAKTLDDFIGKVKYEVMSSAEFNAFNK